MASLGDNQTGQQEREEGRMANWKDDNVGENYQEDVFYGSLDNYKFICESKVELI